MSNIMIDADIESFKVSTYIKFLDQMLVAFFFKEYCLVWTMQDFELFEKKYG